MAGLMMELSAGQWPIVLGDDARVSDLGTTIDLNDYPPPPTADTLGELDVSTEITLSLIAMTNRI